MISDKAFRKIVEKYKYNPDTRCIEWSGSFAGTGYGQVMVDGKNWITHRLSYTLAYGSIPPGEMVRHKCDNRKCGDPDHLELGSNKQNMQDRLDRGHEKAVTFGGENHHHAKLTEYLVKWLRAEYSNGRTAKDIAGELGLHPTAVARAIVGKTWGHVPGAIEGDLFERGERHHGYKHGKRVQANQKLG